VPREGTGSGKHSGCENPAPWRNRSEKKLLEKVRDRNKTEGGRSPACIAVSTDGGGGKIDVRDAYRLIYKRKGFGERSGSGASRGDQ